MGRTGAVPSAARAELAAALIDQTDGHPWPAELPSGWAGGLPGPQPPTQYRRVRPNVVVEISADVAAERGRWRHPVRFHRVRPDLNPADVPTGLALQLANLRRSTLPGQVTTSPLKAVRRRRRRYAGRRGTTGRCRSRVDPRRLTPGRIRLEHEAQLKPVAGLERLRERVRSSREHAARRVAISAGELRPVELTNRRLTRRAPETLLNTNKASDGGRTTVEGLGRVAHAWAESPEGARPAEAMSVGPRLWEHRLSGDPGLGAPLHRGAWGERTYA